MIARQYEEENLLNQAETRIAELTKEVDNLRNWKVKSRLCHSNRLIGFIPLGDL